MNTSIQLLRTAIATLVVAFLALTAGRCLGSRDAREDMGVEQARANGLILARHSLAMRALAESLVTANVTREIAVKGSRDKLAKNLASTQSALDDARGTLADSLSDIAEVRNSLAALSIAAQLSITEGKTYLALADSLLRSHAQERRAFQVALFASDSLVIAKDALLSAVRKQGQCRIIGPIPCPSRTTSFVLGGVTALAVVVAVAR